MSANETQPSKYPSVKVSEWVACLNINDNNIVLSCTVTTSDESASITGVGLILNTGAGITLCTCYTTLTSGSASANPSINMPAGDLAEGSTVNAVAQGECDGKHFFFEEELTITRC